MSENIKIGIIGDDRRLRTVAARLSRRYECAVFGLDSVPENAVKCTSWKSAVKAADAIVLPIPVTRDGKNLNCSTDAISLHELVSLASPGSVVFGGMIPSEIRSLIGERSAFFHDYNDSEAFQIRNAVPTAEGAIAAMIGEMPITLYGMSVTVTGYGKVARALCQRLVALGSTVYVAARRDSALATAATEGCVPVTLSEYLDYPHDTDAIINTVPVRLFDDGVISKIDPKTVYFELAGGDGGIDGEIAQKNGIKVVRLPSLPGKTSPETAGDIMANEILSKLDSVFMGGGDER